MVDYRVACEEGTEKAVNWKMRFIVAYQPHTFSTLPLTAETSL